MKPLPHLFRKYVLNPFIDFISDSKAVGIILLVCTILSLVVANSGFSANYIAFFNLKLPSFSTTAIHLPSTLLHAINDGLMAIFFLLAGMEIKREISNGELSTKSQAILPVVAAFGGMLVPATIFILINKGSIYINGWGIPMATDIAFSLGIAALLGSRMTTQLKVFLTALAIIDDLGAILAIALFYSAQIHWVYLAFSAVIILVFFILSRFKIFGIIQFILAILLWYCFYNSGIHATIAGVVFALFIPVQKLKNFEHKLHMPVNFLIIPLFALANTAIIFPEHIIGAITTTLSLGIVIGLLAGKPIGIFLACFTAIKFKWSKLPHNTGWQHIIGAGLLAGIGFTMSIFIATLAFNDAASVDVSKISSLLGSFLSIIFGIIWFRFFCKPLTS